jgi:hypothetical protein
MHRKFLALVALVAAAPAWAVDAPASDPAAARAIQIDRRLAQVAQVQLSSQIPLVR